MALSTGAPTGSKDLSIRPLVTSTMPAWNSTLSPER